MKISQHRFDEKSTYRSNVGKTTLHEEGLASKRFSTVDSLSKRSNVSFMFKKSPEKQPSIVSASNPPQEICIEKLPKSVYISSRKEERDILKLKDDFMRNKFDHLRFNQYLSCKNSKYRSYFMGLDIKSVDQETEEAIREQDLTKLKDLVE